MCNNAGKNKRKSLINKKKNEHDKIVLLGKAELNTIAVVICRAYISYDEFVLVNNVVREYGDMKEAIKNLTISTVYQRF